MGRNKEENFHGPAETRFYLGNKKLPRATAEFEWTPQMINTLKTEEEYQKKEVDMRFLMERYGASGHVWVPHTKEEPKEEEVVV